MTEQNDRLTVGQYGRPRRKRRLDCTCEVNQYGSLVQAWHDHLDADGNGHLSENEFYQAPGTGTRPRSVEL